MSRPPQGREGEGPSANNDMHDSHCMTPMGGSWLVEVGGTGEVCVCVGAGGVVEEEGKKKKKKKKPNSACVTEDGYLSQK